jgi:2-polyprenyl-3-methyl-5-hydroxy-6-metoxy-1,4-benzoquinol methylase
MTRVALIFDSVLRPETAGVYCHRALERVVEVHCFQPHQLDRVPRHGFDLYLNIDDGLRYDLPHELRPSAFWAIDTHLDFDRCREKAPRFDVVFAAQRDGVELLRGIGVDRVSWLPLACDPGVHQKHEVGKRYDVVFVGNIFPGPRGDLLGLIQRRYRNSFIGQCYFDEMARTYSAARIVFNRSIGSDINMRVFEAVACGSMLMTNDLSENGMAELFRDGVHLATYRDPEDLLDKLAFYLEREAIRERIAAAGRAEAIAKHTYAHRMEKVLTDARGALSKASTAVRWVERGATQQELTNNVNGGRAPAALPGHADFGPATPRASSISAGRPSAPPPESYVSMPPSAETAPDPLYFGHARPEVVALVPETARRVFDIGCGAGRLGEAIKRRQEASVSGIEAHAGAAEAARQRLDQVWDGDVEQLAADIIPAGSFDAIVCADVLEHLREPGRLLERAREWLVADGRLIASLPNVRHYSVVSSLLEGNWTYEPAGLLDETHLRFFTRRDMVDLFERAGFEVADVRVVPGPGYEEWRGAGSPGEVRVGRLHIADIPPDEAEEFFVYQYLMVARPRAARTNGTPVGEPGDFCSEHTPAAAGSPHPGPLPASGAREPDAMPSGLSIAPARSNGSRQQTVDKRRVTPTRASLGIAPGTGRVSVMASALPDARGRRRPRKADGPLRISFLGNFDQEWSTELYAADALECNGHPVNRIHEYGVKSASDVIAQIEEFEADCLVFFKGRIGVDPRDARAVLSPDPSRLLELVRRSPVPAYLWYYDRAYDYPADASRIEWMRKVAPTCRIAFVTDAGLAPLPWANWRVLRQGISRQTVTGIDVAEADREDVAFVGQVYGDRHRELAPLQRDYRVAMISQVFGRELSALIRRHRIIVGPRYPSAPGYWSDRIYVVLGHGGFFLAPEVEGMREEGFVPGVHYAALGDDVVHDVRYWLDRPEQRARIACEGQELVLSKFTYEHRVRALCTAIERD